MGSQRNLIILLLVFVGLGALYFVGSRSRSELDTSGGYVELVEGALSTQEVFGVKIRKGEEEGFTLVKRGDQWFLPGQHDAPANVNKLRTLLGNLETASGERRSSDAAVFGDYLLGDSEALHLQIQDEGGSDLLHLLIGKRSGNGGFVRFADSNEVLRVDHNFLSDFGIWGEEITSPAHGTWIELAAFKANRDDVRTIELSWPDGPLVMSKEFAETALDSTGSVVDPAGYEWRVGSPSNFLAKKTTADGILGSLVGLRARDVVGSAEPDSLGAWGLGDAADHALLRMADGSEHDLLFGSPKGEDQFYFQVAGESLVWSMPNYLRGNIFKDLQALKPE